ncbi:MAG: hypothetical protein EB082_19065, partial [Verrucomicrobia bacterium]|nr:hypothetical protein [Verrucomicrobiota bacterium]
GNKNGDWSWFVNVNRTSSSSQPLVFPTRLVSAGTAPAAASGPSLHADVASTALPPAPGSCRQTDHRAP